jgi:hypothetical protein
MWSLLLPCPISSSPGPSRGASSFFWKGTAVACKSCQSNEQKRFTAEIAIHFPGLKNLDKPAVWVFPQLLICFDCGKAEFGVPESELRALGKDQAATAS